jgi:DivIVA domain-containing protein
VSSTFPHARPSRRGYSVAEVEDFLEDARQAYTAPTGNPVGVDAALIRTIGFTMQKGGYSPTHVDAALERLEEAFATRERERVFSQPGGDAAWYTKARSTAQTILDRLDREQGKRFKRVSVLRTGYRTRDVDDFTDRLIDYFQHGKALSIEQVRSVVFRRARGGYEETQVDFLLDTVVNVMLAVR